MYDEGLTGVRHKVASLQRTWQNPARRSSCVIRQPLAELLPCTCLPQCDCRPSPVDGRQDRWASWDRAFMAVLTC